MNELIISVSGVRGVVGDSLTPQAACELALAFSTMLAEAGESGMIAVGRDSRPSGLMLEQAVCAGLLGGGLGVRPLGVVATPTCAMAVRDLRCIGGVMVTASHNPDEYNGIKFLTSAGQARSADAMARLRSIFQAKSFKYAGPASAGRVQPDHGATERHVQKVIGRVDVESIRRARLPVLLDSVNGAGGVGGAKLLETLGCRVMLDHTEPTGLFPRPPEPIPEHLGEVCRRVAETHAAVGFVQDPDADRLVLIDEVGRCVGEEYTLALAAKAVLAQTPGPVAANLSTSRMIDDVAAAAGVRVFRTPVGEANVAQAVAEHDCVIGGEGNGGVIDPKVVTVRDSLTGMALILQLLAGSGQPLSRHVAELPRYTMLKKKFPLPAGGIEPMLAKLASTNVGGLVNDADGIRIDWPEGWVHIRPSNTEPIYRIIAEAADEATAAALTDRVRQLAGVA